MSLSAALIIAMIYLSPCYVKHPPDVSCRQYAVHLAAERAYESDQGSEDSEDQGDTTTECRSIKEKGQNR